MTARKSFGERKSTQDYRAELYWIEIELDKTAPWEDPPLRYRRQKLNRQKASLIRKAEGEDPLFSVDKLRPHQTCFSHLDDRQKAQYRMKKAIMGMKKALGIKDLYPLREDRGRGR
jgi:hypothetical protein